MVQPDAADGGRAPAEGDTHYIDQFPKPLLDDLLAKRWLPIIGAGLSHNAQSPDGLRPPLWDELGQLVAAQIPEGYEYSTPMDAVSTYCHLYRLPLLAQLLAELLLVHKARPGPVHEALARLPFDMIVTTNIDFLLEKSYQRTEYTRVLMDDTDLSVAPHDPGVVDILKIHGDVHNPEHLVVTEEAYDEFLVKYPILATFLANLLVERTAVLIGYSMEDPDLRQIWQIVRSRLGDLSRPAFAIRVDASGTESDRFKRRDISVINLRSTAAKNGASFEEVSRDDRYQQVLTDVFRELHTYQRERILAASRIHEESVHKQALIPLGKHKTRLCLFAVPSALHSFYKEFVFPEAVRAGLVPVVEEDIESPGGNIPAEIDALLVRASAVFIHADEMTPTTAFEMRLTKANESQLQSVFVVLDTNPRNHEDLQFEYKDEDDRRARQFEYTTDEDLFERADALAVQARAWFTKISDELEEELCALPEAVLDDIDAKSRRNPKAQTNVNFAPALIAAYSNVEAQLARILEELRLEKPGERPAPLWTLIRRAEGVLGKDHAALSAMDAWWKDTLNILHKKTSYSVRSEVEDKIERVRRVSDEVFTELRKHAPQEGSAGPEKAQPSARARRATPVADRHRPPTRADRS